MAKNRRQVALPSPPEMRHTAQAKANVTREWFTVATAQAGTTTTATVHINDTIGEDMFFGGVDSAALIAEIDGLRVDQLDVRINSLGGNAHDGMAIANAILRNKAATTTYIDGIAASAASVIALAADRVVISKYGQMMVHNSSGLAVGGAEDIRGYANYLDSLDATMADYYADRAGGDTKTWAKAMKAETWYRAEEALAAGLVTDIDTSAVREDVEASITAAMASPAAQFMNVGRPAVPAAARADTSKEAPVADKKTLAESLGLGADATEEDILKATRDTLGITDDDTETPAGDAGGDAGEVDAPDTASPVGTQELAAAVASAEKAGGVFIPNERLQRLERQAGEGAAALAAQVAAGHAAKIDAAIAAGKILPTEKDKYAALMRADEATTTALLDQIPAEARAPITEMGHATGQQEPQDVTDNTLYANWRF